MARKRKTLPKDFPEILNSGDMAAMQAVFEKCELDARGGYSKKTALAFAECPDTFARWLVKQGADIEARDAYGSTPLQNRAGHWQGDLTVLLELGADVHATSDQGTPLHSAAMVHNLAAARLLLEKGADPRARNAQGLTPLGAALQRCSNAKLDTMAPIARLLLEAGAADKKPTLLQRITGKAIRSEASDPALREMVRTIGENFEFHRTDFNPDSIDAADAGLTELYRLFDVAPVSRRAFHPLDAPIPIPDGSWQQRHDRLWQMLVPGKGAAPSVQGEVIRISGRIADELERNGGVNWDADYASMAEAFAAHVATGNPLRPDRLDLARATVGQIKARRGDPLLLMELAVEWVAANHDPVPLPPPDYVR